MQPTSSNSQPWDIENYPKVPNQGSYHLEEASEAEQAMVLALYEKNPVRGFKISKIETIFNQTLQSFFDETLMLLEKLGELLPSIPMWSENAEKKALQEKAPSKIDPRHKRYDHVEVSPLFSGIREGLLQSIYEMGFDHLYSKKDGWMGNAFYFTNDATYALLQSDGKIVFSWVAYLRSYPVTSEDQNHKFLPNHLHYTFVKPYSENGLIYLPAKNSSETVLECAIDQSELVLPRYVIHFTPMPGTPSPALSTSLNRGIEVALTLLDKKDASFFKRKAEALLSKESREITLQDREFIRGVQKLGDPEGVLTRVARSLMPSEFLWRLDDVNLDAQLSARLLRIIMVEQLSVKVESIDDAIKLGEEAERELNYNQAVLYYKWAANQNDLHAYSKLGQLYEKGLGVSYSLLKAVQYYLHAQKYTSALKCLHQLEKQGNKRALALLSMVYCQGLGVKIDLIKATGYARLVPYSSEAKITLKTAAEAGIAASYYPYACSIENENKKEAAVYFEKARCLLKAAHCYREVNELQNAIGLYQKLIGSAEAYYWRAKLSDDLTQSEKLYKSSADQGFVLSQYQLAKIYLEQGKFKDAEMYFELAVAQHYMPAYSELATLKKSRVEELVDAGDLYLHAGQWDEALACYTLSEKAGSAKGSFALARCHHIGLGTPPNRLLASKLYQQAATKGYKPAHLPLAFFHKYGLEIPVDNAAASRHFDLAKTENFQSMAFHFFNTSSFSWLVSKKDHIAAGTTIAVAIATLDPGQKERSKVIACITQGLNPSEQMDLPLVVATKEGSLSIRLTGKLLSHPQLLTNLHQLGVVGRPVHRNEFQKNFLLEFLIPKVQVRSFLMEHLQLAPIIYNDLVANNYKTMLIEQEDQKPFQKQVPANLMTLFNQMDYKDLQQIAKDTTKSYPLSLQAFPSLMATFPRQLSEAKVLDVILGGSTGAKKLQYKGVFFIQKNPSPKGGVEHLKVEYFTNKIYRSMGALVPEVKWYDGKNPCMLAQFIDSVDLRQYLKHPSIPEAKKELTLMLLRRHFVLDSLLANWDVIGLDADNVRVDKQGFPWRIDNGSGLNRRAQGELKPDQSWSGKVLDLNTLRDPNINPSAAAYFKFITNEEIQEQIDEILIHQTVILDATPTEFKGLLKQRLFDLATTENLSH